MDTLHSQNTLHASAQPTTGATKSTQCLEFPICAVLHCKAARAPYPRAGPAAMALLPHWQAWLLWEGLHWRETLCTWCRSPPSCSINQSWTHGTGSPFPLLLVIILGIFLLSYFLSFIKYKVVLTSWITPFNLVCVLILLLGMLRTFLSTVLNGGKTCLSPL